MVEIMSADSVARETIRKILEREVPLANEAIQCARGNGERTAYVRQKLSAGTIMLLEKAGYYVDYDSASTEISWEGRYNELIENAKLIEELANELNVRIVNCENGGNIIDPNWKPQKYEDD